MNGFARMHGVVSAATDARGFNTFYGYDNAGRSVAVTNALLQVNRSVYDEAGNLTLAIDALGRTNRFFYVSVTGGTTRRAGHKRHSIGAMTTTTGGTEILKTDVLGRVKTPAARREQLLDEFECSGLSGQKFAELAGLRYQTFASWAQKRRRQRGDYPASKVPPRTTDSTRWLEAVVDGVQTRCDKESPALPVLLPGGARLEISCTRQIPLAVALFRELEKPSAASC